MMRRLPVVLLSLLVFSCQPGQEHGHSHGEGTEHAHAHDSGVTREYTVWTAQTELFVEFPALVVGKTSRFAAHFTKLQGHQPVQEGAVSVSLIKGNKGIRHTAEAPSSPGIFTPALQPKEAGIYQLIFDLKTPVYSDKIVIEGVQVFASVEEAQNAVSGEAEAGNAIAFLKEQAWKMDFQTAPVTNKEIYQTIPASGVWRAAPADYHTLIAPAEGQVVFASGKLTQGAKVKKGEVLLTVRAAGLTSNNLDTEIQKARVHYEQAKAEYERNEQLYQDRIVSRTQYEEIKQHYETLKANFENLSSGYVAGGKQVIAPIDGYIRSLATANGDYAAQGDVMLSISSRKNNLLQLQVSPQYNLAIQNIHDLWYQPEAGKWSSLYEQGGEILSVSREVTPDQPLLSLYAAVNEGIAMPEGSLTEVQLALGESQMLPSIPAEALLEAYGTYAVIVQTSGESFEIRAVQVGNRNGRDVAIINGLQVGEVVVTKGAYQVKMASMSGQAPEHGHAH